MKRLVVLLALTIALLPAATSTAQAQSSGGYVLTWSTIDGGGGKSTGDNYTLAGTIGQPEGVAMLHGGDYALSGGFWGKTLNQLIFFLPAIMKTGSTPPNRGVALTA
jgi:hypothetical protein